MKCGLLLSGCGFQDGGEVQESVFCLHSLQKRNIEVVSLSIDEPQRTIVHHNTGETVRGERNVLEESARVSRGEVKNLKGFDFQKLDGLVIPGGFGCALNLSDFALKGEQMKIHSEVEKLLKHFYEARKPIAAVCIAPVLVAKVLGSYGPFLTVGDNEEVESCMESFGAQTKKCEEGSYVLDKKNRIVSTPAYMYASSNTVPVAEGIDKMCEAFLALH